MAQPVPTAMLPAKNGPVGGRSLAELVLSRLGTGIGPGEAVAFNHIGYATWLEQQLNPPKGDDPATAGGSPAPPCALSTAPAIQRSSSYGRQSTRRAP